MNSINLNWIIEAYNQTKNKEEFFNDFFDKLSGSDLLRKQIISGKNSEEIKLSWIPQIQMFKKTREKYLIY